MATCFWLLCWNHPYTLSGESILPFLINKLFPPRMIPVDSSIGYPGVMIWPKGKQGGRFTQVSALSVEVNPTHVLCIYITIRVHKVQ